MNAFWLKIIAIVTMVFDHAGYLIFGGFSFFNYIGRLAFPIFAFQISQGYIHTSNFKKYATRLGLFALISQIPFALFISMLRETPVEWTSIRFFFTDLNIFFTLFLGLIAIAAYDKLPAVILRDSSKSSSSVILSETKWSRRILIFSIGFPFVAALAWFSTFINADYGWFGVAIIFLFYLFRDKKVFMTVFFIACVILHYAPRLFASNFHQIHLTLLACTIVPILFILLYNGKKGRNLKQWLYWFYPVHLLILYIIYVFI